MKIWIIIGVLLLGFTNMSLAEEEEMGYSWGVVKEASDDSIVVAEYDYDADAEVDVTYSIDSDTMVFNVETLKDIVEGDNIEIDYVVRGNKNIAKAITLETIEEEIEY